MSTSATIWIIIAVILTLLGAILFTSVMIAYDWDFTKLSTGKYTTNTYDINEDFDKISIEVDTTAIEFVLSDNDKCKIVCYESEKVKHSATVKNGTLVIEISDNRKWYEYIGISIGSPKMTVYMPKKDYGSLFIDTDTGHISISKDFTFDSIQIDGHTSHVECFASVRNSIKIELSTGNITIDTLTAGCLDFTTDTGRVSINSVTVTDDVKIRTDTGLIKLNNSSCKNFTSESDTGLISFENVSVTEKLSVKNDTGNVRFNDSDANEIYVKTSTGDVTGTLLTDKVFIARSSTGRINVPKTITGGRCEITTSTGDINISVK